MGRVIVVLKNGQEYPVECDYIRDSETLAGKNYVSFYADDYFGKEKFVAGFNMDEIAGYVMQREAETEDEIS